MATTNSPVLNPTPKARLFANKTALSAHNELVRREDLQRSFEVALAEYNAQLMMQDNKNDSPSYFNKCAEAHLKAKGAAEFIQIFKSLGQEIQRPVIVDRDNLQQQ